MIKKNSIEFQNKKFSSKEIGFLKSDSGTEKTVDIILKEYLSDNIFSDSLWMESFLQMLDQTEFHDGKFLCAVIRQNFPAENKAHTSAAVKDINKNACENNSIEKYRKKNYTNKEHKTEKQKKNNTDQSVILSTEILLSKLARDNHGIWDRINNNIFVIAMEYSDRKNNRKTVQNIKNHLSRTCKAPVAIGIAEFPFLDFTKKDTFYNAVKALDHSAFTGDDNLVFFDAVSLNISGDRLYHIGRTKDAAEEYRKGLEIEKDNINLLNSLGVCFGMMKKLEMANEEFQKAMDIDDREIMAVYNTGLVYEIKNDTEKALEYFIKASAINDEIFEIELGTGKQFYRTKKFAEALVHLKKAVKLNPVSSAPFRIMGDIFLEKAQYTKAAAAYKKAIKINPDDPFSLSGLGAAFEKQDKNLDIALSFARKSVAMEPENNLFRKRLDKIYQKKEADNIVHLKFEKSYT